MNATEIIDTYCGWFIFLLNFCISFLAALWLYRIWRRTEDDAYLCLSFGMGFLLLLEDVAIIVDYFLPSENFQSFMWELFSISGFCTSVTIILGLILLDKNRIPRRDFIPLAVQNAIRSSMSRRLPSTPIFPMAVPRVLSVLVLLVIAFAVVVQTIRSLYPDNSLLGGGSHFVSVWIVDPFILIWLFRLWQLTRDKGYLWLMAAFFSWVVFIPFYRLIPQIVSSLGFLTSNTSLIDVIVWYAFDTASALLDVFCTVMALRTMADGAVTFREVFFPSVKEAEES